jgi:lipopolysaccharide transport system permease protein
VADTGKDWDVVIKSKSGLLDLRLGDVWRYRDLLWMFVRRDFISFYKQTILGPFWFLIQPIFTMTVYVIIFGGLARIPTEDVPAPLFYLSGILAWSYFLDCLNKTSNVFRENQSIFGKVYFPRLIMPLSIVLSNLVRFFVQLILLLIVYVFFRITGKVTSPNAYILLFPYLVVLMAFQGMGLGMIVSALTTKYRDLAYLISFGSQLLMYATPVVYPLSFVPVKYRFIIEANPMTYIIEGIRFGFFGKGQFDLWNLAYVSIISVVLLFVGLVTYKQVEKTFVDTI